MVGKRDRVSNYYSVKNGKVVLSLGKVQPDVMDGVTERVNKNGEKVYEIVNDYIAGRIIKLDLEAPPEDKPDYKELMVITMEGDGTKAIVQIPFDSAYGRGFLCVAEGIDFSQPIEIEPYKYTDKKSGREKSGVGVYQFGKQLDWTMGTKNKPGDVPTLEKTTFKGKEVWDNTKQLEFFHDFYAKLAEHVESLQSPGDGGVAAFIDDQEEEDIDF